MKKLIQSEHARTIKCCLPRKTDGPKPLICNNWKTRNDSTNIQAILHPELHVKIPRKYIKDIPNQPTGHKNEVYKKECLSSNTCYCKEKPSRPTLIRRPNKCLSLEAFESKYRPKNLSKTKNSLYCFCKGTQASASYVDLSDIETLKKYHDELDEVNPHLQITDQRKDYEMYREEEYNNYLKDIEKYENTQNYVDEVKTMIGTKSYPQDNSNNLICGDLTSNDYEKFGCIDTSTNSHEARLVCSGSCSRKTTGTRTEPLMKSTDTPVSTLNTHGSIDTEIMRKFRDENYFETHDIHAHLGKDIPEHTCVHQFRLDDRLLPQAVSIDRFGKSRCTICNKPMEGSSKSEKSVFSDKITREKIRKFSKCLELGLVPHDVSIGAPAKIELKVKTKDVIKFGRFIGSYQRPCSTNTFALRQQKMSKYSWH